MTYRNRKLLDLCHEITECQLRIPERCVGHVPAGCEPAHGPKGMFEGGTGIKSSDVPCAACGPCHRELDQGRLLTKDERRFYWMRGALRTMTLLLHRELVKVADKAIAIEYDKLAAKSKTVVL